MFGNNPNAKHLAARVHLPSIIDEENRKIGEDFLNLKTKGIYSFSNLTYLYKYIPPEIKSKYDTHEDRKSTLLNSSHITISYA